MHMMSPPLRSLRDKKVKPAGAAAQDSTLNGLGGGASMGGPPTGRQNKHKGRGKDVRMTLD